MNGMNPQAPAHLPSASTPTAAWRVLLVDDEPLARSRLRSLLADISRPATEVCGEAGSAAQAIELLESAQPHIVLLDINMPGMDGMQLAQRLKQRLSPVGRPPPQIVFVTASSDFALQAFDVAAADYLTKPVRAERLQQALLKATAAWAMQQEALAGAGSAQPAVQSTPNGMIAGQMPVAMNGPGQGVSGLAAAGIGGAVAGSGLMPGATTPPAQSPSLLIQERGLSHRLDLNDILYARAEQKYVILYTRLGREWVWDGSLIQLEDKYPQFFVRIHRSTLVQRQLLRQLKHSVQADGSEGWLLQIEGVTHCLPVSRRQLPAVRQAMQTL
ncbi:MAG: LytTR family DNA-binding domain-containing protein [Brachymonas sp.]|nr:LytTR family DNA-binding domain-containing protein [Brachymonas sp.]